MRQDFYPLEYDRQQDIARRQREQERLKAEEEESQRATIKRLRDKNWCYW